MTGGRSQKAFVVGVQMERKGAWGWDDGCEKRVLTETRREICMKLGNSLPLCSRLSGSSGEDIDSAVSSPK